MKKKHLFSAIFGAFTLVALSGCSLPTKQQAIEIVTPSVYAQHKNFSYEDYTQKEFNALKGSEAFSVFVHSKTCGTCAKKDKQIINEVNTFDDGVILKMEYSDAPQEFLKTYGVTKYDTFINFKADGSHETIKGAEVSEVRSNLVQNGTVDSNIIAQSDNFIYQNFDKPLYDSLRGNETFAIFFHSKTCGTCAKKNKQIIEEVSQFTGGQILKIEYSEAPQELLKEFDVTTYDSFVVLEANGAATTIKGANVSEVRELLSK